MPPTTPIICRGIAMLGVLFAALVAQAVALHIGNETHAIGAMDGRTPNLDRDSGQVLTIPLKRFNHRGVVTPSIAKRLARTKIFGVYGAAYLAELTMGTSTDGNKQVIDVLIDTGSFELWVNPNCSTSNVPDFCKAFGHYDPALSSTSQKLDKGFGIKYGSGQVMGAYYTDDIYISGSRIKGQQFGVANTSEVVWFGIMGLGHGQGNGFIDYPLVIDSLAAQGLTNTKLFSMDLGKQISPGAVVTGEMVFGGVDTNKYAGLLKKVPTDPADPHYKITLNSLAHRTPGAGTATTLSDPSLPLPMIVDSGTTLSLLPEALVGKLAAQFPGAEPDGEGGYRVDCALQQRDGSVDFEFRAANGTVTVNVAYSDFIWNSGGDCFLGAWFSDDLGVWILGDSFLRGAYVAFDQTNHALFMSNRLSCGDGQSNPVAVPAGPDAAAHIPGSCQAGTVPSPALSGASAAPATNTSAPMSSTPFTVPSPPSSSPSTLAPLSPPSDTIPGTPPVSSPSPLSGVSTISGTSTGDTGSNDVGPSSTAGPSAAPGTGTGTGTDTGMSTSTSTRPNFSVVNGEATDSSTHTVTSTITRAVVYTVTACPETVRDCPLRGKVATRFETVTTTFCPGHDGGIPIPLPTPTPAPAPAAIPVPAPVSVAVSLAPPASVSIATPSTNKLKPAPRPSAAIDGPAGAFGDSNEEPEWDERPPGEEHLTTAHVTTTITTTAYAITSCGHEDAACTVGATTTRAVTLVKTVQVRPVPTASRGGNATWSGGQGPVIISGADDVGREKRLVGMLVFVCGVMLLL